MSTEEMEILFYEVLSNVLEESTPFWRLIQGADFCSFQVPAEELK